MVGESSFRVRGVGGSEDFLGASTCQSETKGSASTSRGEAKISANAFGIAAALVAAVAICRGTCSRPTPSRAGLFDGVCNGFINLS